MLTVAEYRLTDKIGDTYYIAAGGAESDCVEIGHINERSQAVCIHVSSAEDLIEAISKTMEAIKNADNPL